MRCERIRSHAERSASASWRRKASCSDRKVSGALATRFARYWHLRCQQSWIWRRIPTRLTRRREWQMKQFKSTGQAQRFVTAHDQINNLFHLRRDHVTAAEYRAARMQTFRVRRKLAAALPLRYKSPTLLAQPRESSRPRPNKLPVPDRLLLHPIIVHPIINEDAGRDFRHRQRRCFRRDSTDTQMRCSSTAGTPTGRRPSTTASNMGCLAGSGGLRKRIDYLISAQAYALISSPTAISMMRGVFHFIAVFLNLILAGGKSRVAAKRRRIRQT